MGCRSAGSVLDDLEREEYRAFDNEEQSIVRLKELVLQTLFFWCVEQVLAGADLFVEFVENIFVY